MVSPFRVIREELPRFLNEPHAAEFKEVMGSLLPSTPSEVAMEVAFAPISKPARLASLAASALTHSPEAEGAPLSKIAKWMDEAIAYARNRRLYDAGEEERIERIAQELPVVPEIFSPQAVAEKAVFAPPNSLVGMSPREFLKTAWPLDTESARPYIEHYKDLIREGKFVDPQPGLFNGRYVEAQRAKEFKGFEDVPFLRYRQMYDDRPLLSQQAVGHEGRHRNMVISELFGPDTPSLVHMVPGYNQRNLDFISTIYPETESVSDLMYRSPIELDRRRRYAKGGLAQHLEGLGFTPEDTQYALEQFEKDRKYFPHQGMTNYESRPEMYLTRAPSKIVPQDEWKYGESVGGTHNFLEGIQVPNRSRTWMLPEVLAHEAQHSMVASLPPEEILDEGRQEAQKSVLNRLMEYLRPLNYRDYPEGFTGRDQIEELAPEMIAAEGYLPAGLSMIRSELGQKLLQTPEEKLWYMSRRYPRRTDIDAMTGASPD